MKLEKWQWMLRLKAGKSLEERKNTKIVREADMKKRRRIKRGRTDSKRVTENPHNQHYGTI